MDVYNLDEVLFHLKTCDIYILENRFKNYQYFIEHDMSIHYIEFIVRNLTKKECFGGPEPDDHIPPREGVIYKFKKVIPEIGFAYIKICIIDEVRPVIVISFHNYERNYIC